MFEGYRPETLDFLWGIRMNNSREWFLPHKGDYTRYLYEPTKALAQEVFQPFLEVPGLELKVSRIYRDARLHHPLPYKESLWFCIRREVDSWSEHPALFFEINPEGASYGFTLWRPRPGTMEAFRQALLARPEAFLSLLEKTQAAAGLPITAECYKREKPCPDPRVAAYYNWKADVSCILREPVGPGLFEPELSGRVRRLLTALLPWNEYWQGIAG